MRIGGQALADGVLMRTSHAWAVARDDGSVQVGSVRQSRVRRIPVVRVLVGLVGAMRLAIGRGMLGRGTGAARAAGVRRRNRRFLWALLAVEAVGLAFSMAVGDQPSSFLGAATFAAVPWALAFAVLRVVAPASLWRYHGAEHKAVAAHEAGIDMADVASVLRSPRVHDRCGTNLVFLAMVGGLALMGLPSVLQLPAFALLFATAAEAVTLASRRPRFLLSRLLLAGGRTLQRYVTTAEPSQAEQAVGCRALAACLEHHRRLTGVASVAGLSPAVELAAA